MLDGDGDGMDDNWEIQYFGTTNVGMGTNANGLTHLQEYIAGLNPDSNSVFRIDSSCLQGTNMAFSWMSVSDRFYTVLSTTNLLSPWITNLYLLPGDNTEKAYTNTDSSLMKFFRITVGQ